MTATSAIDFEVGHVHGHHFAVPPFLAHGDEAGVGKVHLLIGVFVTCVTQHLQRRAEPEGYGDKPITERARTGGGSAASGSP